MFNSIGLDSHTLSLGIAEQKWVVKSTRVTLFETKYGGNTYSGPVQGPMNIPRVVHGWPSQIENRSLFYCFADIRRAHLRIKFNFSNCFIRIFIVPFAVLQDTSKPEY